MAHWIQVVEGDGEPEKRIDLMQMVRKGDLHPCTFVAETDKPFSVEDVLTVYNNQDIFMEMKQNADSSEFWPALNFWIFFAVRHPILQPILWISDVLHGTPGPKVLGDSLVPILFLCSVYRSLCCIATDSNSYQYCRCCCFYRVHGSRYGRSRIPERRSQGCFCMEQVPNRCIQWHAIQWEHLTLITTGKLCGVQLGLTSFWNCSRNPLRTVGDKQCNNTKNMPKGHLHVNSLLCHASHWSQTIDMHQLKTIMRIIILHHAGHCPFLSLDKYFRHALKVM